MPRKSTASSSQAPPGPPLVLILDNGAHTIKAGLSTAEDPSPKLFPNAIFRSKADRKATTYVGDEVDECKDFSGLLYRRAFERGMLTNWDNEKRVWDRLLGPQSLNVDPHTTPLLLTVPPLTPPNILASYDQIVFEEYEFPAYYACPAAALLSYGNTFGPDTPAPECCLVVDTGFSFTHVVPVIQGRVIESGVRRIDMGGKLLTNHLKELVSFRQWNLMDQSHVIEEVKEKCSFLSPSFDAFDANLRMCKADPTSNPIIREYVLPDYSTAERRRGRVRSLSDAPADPDDQILTLANERFSVPELLFCPGYIGLDQCGLPEAIADSIASLQVELQGLFWANIAVVGGNALFDGFAERLRNELRPLAPAEAPLRVVMPENPITAPYYAARVLARSPAFPALCITREEYLESGSGAVRRKFGGDALAGLGWKGMGMGIF